MVQSSRIKVSEQIKCDCGKLLAILQDGKVTVKCRGCGRIVPLVIINQSQEPNRAKSR